MPRFERSVIALGWDEQITCGLVTQMGGGGGTPDEFAHLFRPETESGDAAGEPASEQPVAPPAAPPTAEPTPQGGMRFPDPPLPEPQVPESAVELVAAPEKEGRLFRSRGAPERDDALTAIGSMQARRLRTMARGDDPGAPNGDEFLPPELIIDEVVAEPVPILPTASSGEPAPALQVMSGAARTVQDLPSRDERRRERRASRPDDQRRGSGSLTALGVYAVTIGVTVILAFGETLFFGGEPGLITGIGLLIVSIFAAFAVRTSDGIHAIFAPPIAFLIASLTAGQVGVTSTGITGRAVVVFFLLGGNWIWIVGSTAAALVIVALRRRLR
ncbi:MAG: hypothetical protein ACO3YU_05660 [Candidatus Nanopelagicales bacterium]